MKMVVASEQMQLKRMLSDAIPLLCKSSLRLLNLPFSVEAIVGITINENDVVLISFKETVLPDGITISHSWQECSNETEMPAYDDKKEDGDSGECIGDTIQDVTPSVSIIRTEGGEFSNDMSCFAGNTAETDMIQYIYDTDVTEVDCEWKPLMNQTEYTIPSMSGCESEDKLHKMKGHCSYNTEHATLKTTAKVIPLNSDDAVENFNCSIVKEERQDMDEDCDLSVTGNRAFQEDKHGESRYAGGACTIVQKGLLRRGIGGYHRMPSKAGHPYSQKSLRTIQQQTSAASCSVRHRGQVPSKSLQCFSEATTVSRKQLQKSYDNMMDALRKKTASQSAIVTTTGEKQFACHICQARLSSPNNLLAHIQGTHLALDRYQCHICLEKFRWYMQLHRHRKRCHADILESNI